MEERQERIIGIIGLGAVGIFLFAFKDYFTSPGITTTTTEPPIPPNPNTKPPDEPPPIPKPPEKPPVKPPVEEPKIPPQTLQAYDELCKLIEDNIFEEGGVLKFIDKERGEKEGFAWMEKWGYLVPIFSPTPVGIVSAKKWMDIQLMRPAGKEKIYEIPKVYEIRVETYGGANIHIDICREYKNELTKHLLFTKEYPLYCQEKWISTVPELVKSGRYILKNFSQKYNVIWNEIIPLPWDRFWTGKKELVFKIIPKNLNSVLEIIKNIVRRYKLLGEIKSVKEV